MTAGHQDFKQPGASFDDVTASSADTLYPTARRFPNEKKNLKYAGRGP